MSALSASNSSGASDGEISRMCIALLQKGQVLQLHGNVPGAILKSERSEGRKTNE